MVVKKKASKKSAGRSAKVAKSRKATRKVVRKAAKKTVRKSVKKASRNAAPRAPRQRARKKSPLTKAQLAQFREMLLLKRRALIGDMNGIEAEALGAGRKQGGGEMPNMPTHPADIGTDNFEQEFTLGLLESERVMLTDIDEALQRIEDRTYGICLGTGGSIGIRRLRARPWAKYCIEYARMVEKGLVRPVKDAEGKQFEDEEEGFEE